MAEQKTSTFQAAGDAIALARGQVPDKTMDRLKMQAALKSVEGETSDDYFAFREWIFSGPRRKFNYPAELLNRSVAWVKTRAKQFNWEERALQYDEAVTNLAATAHAEESERMAARHARNGRVLQAVGMKLVKNLDTAPGNNHKLAEITGLIRAGTDVERKAVDQEEKKEEVVVIVASFQEAANVKSKSLEPGDPQDAGAEEDPTVIDLADLGGGSFAPAPAEGDEGTELA